MATNENESTPRKLTTMGEEIARRTAERTAEITQDLRKALETRKAKDAAAAPPKPKLNSGQAEGGLSDEQRRALMKNRPAVELVDDEPSASSGLPATDRQLTMHTYAEDGRRAARLESIQKTLQKALKVAELNVEFRDGGKYLVTIPDSKDRKSSAIRAGLETLGLLQQANVAYEWQRWKVPVDVLKGALAKEGCDPETIDGLMQEKNEDLLANAIRQPLEMLAPDREVMSNQTIVENKDGIVTISCIKPGTSRGILFPKELKDKVTSSGHGNITFEIPQRELDRAVDRAAGRAH